MQTQLFNANMDEIKKCDYSKACNPISCLKTELLLYLLMQMETLHFWKTLLVSLLLHIVCPNVHDFPTQANMICCIIAWCIELTIYLPLSALIQVHGKITPSV